MRLATLAVLLLSCAAVAPLHAAVAPLPLIPMPAQVERGEGGFSVDANTPVRLGSNDAATRASADYLVALLARTRGLSLQVGGANSGAASITLTRDPQAPVQHAEGYALDIDAHGVRITARDDAGLFYGVITLWQLLTPDARHGAAWLPALHIRDQPRFAWRGLMLDSARHYQTPDEIRTLLDQMAQHKLNVFHWHLTDDQGWRIEIKRYPELTRTGAWRTPPQAGHDGEPERYGGFYTQDEIRQLVAYAAARHITIVPELDMPGHAQAAVAAYPELGVTGRRPAVSVDWGVNPYLYNVDDASFVFIGHVLDEVMALFPSTYIHVGGDEAVKDQWRAAPAVQAKLHALGLKNEDALQGWFIGRVGEYLKAHGRRLIGWDEILEGGVPADATVMSWRGVDGAIAAAKLGHDVVLSPAPDLYLDSLQSAHADEGSGRMPVRDLAAVYAFEPVPKVLDAAQSAHVLGAQANIWTEHLPSIRHVQRAAFPRLDALAEATWSPVAVRSWQGFLARLPAQFARYRAQDIGYADSAFAAEITVDENAALASGKATVRLGNQAGYGQLRYTLDGSAPDAHAMPYRAPFAVRLPVTVRAAAFADDGSALAAPRERVLDRAQLLARDGGALANCPGSDFRLRVQPMPDATTLAPVYAVNLFDSCMRYLSARLDDVHAIRVDAVRLERNYALAGEAKLVVAHAAATAYGELAVHRDRCDGPLLASLPLPDPAHSGRQFALAGALPPGQGVHDLCLIYTAPVDGPLYAIGRVALLPDPGAPTK
jgi:hexosaminidase